MKYWDGIRDCCSVRFQGAAARRLLLWQTQRKPDAMWADTLLPCSVNTLPLKGAFGNHPRQQGCQGELMSLHSLTVESFCSGMYVVPTIYIYAKVWHLAGMYLLSICMRESASVSRYLQQNSFHYLYIPLGCKFSSSVWHFTLSNGSQYWY